MSKTTIPSRASSDEVNVADQLVRARLEARALAHFPGVVPADLPAAYRCQDAAIARWPEPIGGWKVSMFLTPERQAGYGEERMMGPAFVSKIRRAAPGQVVEIPVIAGGFPGVESEVVVRIGRDAPADKFDWTLEEASEMVGEMCMGVEIVSSALSSQLLINLAVCASDFGFNFGIVIGSPIPEWRALQEISSQCFVEGQPAASFPRGVVSLRDRTGPLGALAYALGHCARRGYPMRAGAAIATGTITGGLITLRPGQTSSHIFDGIGEVRCRAVDATARPEAPRSTQ